MFRPKGKTERIDEGGSDEKGEHILLTCTRDERECPFIVISEIREDLKGRLCRSMQM